MPRVAYLTHPDCPRHDIGPWHPESPKRWQAVDEALRGAPWFGQLLQITPPQATLELCALADRHAQGRVVSVLEGGYDLAALGCYAVGHVEAMQ